MWSFPANSKDLTPATNLVGVSKINDTIFANVNISGSENINISQSMIKDIVKKELSGNKIKQGTGEGVPVLKVFVAGEGTGGGGIKFIVTVHLTTTIDSPYKKGNTIDAIIWTESISEEHIMKYDPKVKKIVNVSGKPEDKIISSLKNVIRNLCKDIKTVNM